MIRVLITRPRTQANAFAESLRAIGAEPIFLPTIAIQPVEDTAALDSALLQLADYDWLILTSANAADVVLDRMASLGISAPPPKFARGSDWPKDGCQTPRGRNQPELRPRSTYCRSDSPRPWRSQQLLGTSPYGRYRR